MKAPTVSLEPDDAALVAELGELLAKATPGPWATDERGYVITPPWRDTGLRHPENIAHLYDGEYIENPKSAEDAALIVALVNAAPRLLELASLPAPVNQNGEGVTQGWQPIETAPKNGSVDVDLWVVWQGQGERIADCRARMLNGKLDWHTRCDERGWTRINGTAVSWRPLPAAPEGHFSPSNGGGK